MHEELKLDWTYGFSPACGIHFLTPQLLLYTASNIAVLFDTTRRTQRLLRDAHGGHNAPITCCCTAVCRSSDCIFVATADNVERICVWKLLDAKTLLKPTLLCCFRHGGNYKCAAMALSSDGNFIGAIVCQLLEEDDDNEHKNSQDLMVIQRLKIWDLRRDVAASIKNDAQWNNSDGYHCPLLYASEVVATVFGEGKTNNHASMTGNSCLLLHTSLEFSPSSSLQAGDNSTDGCSLSWELVSNNSSEVCFWGLTITETVAAAGDKEPDEIISKRLTAVRPSISKQANALFAPQQYCFLRSFYLPSTTRVLTSTKCGDLIVWDFRRAMRAEADNLTENDACSEVDRVFVKCMKTINKGTIVGVRIMDHHIVIAGKDEILIYDFDIWLEAWFDNTMEIGPIAGFDVVASPLLRDLDTVSEKTTATSHLDVDVPVFALATKDKKIVLASVSNSSEKCLSFRTLVEAVDDFGVSVDFHASGEKFVVAYPTGKIQVWDSRNHSLLSSHAIDIHGQLKVMKYLESPRNSSVLAVGTTVGNLHLIDLEDDKHPGQIMTSGDSSEITIIHSSNDDKWISVAKSNGHVALYQQCMVERNSRFSPSGLKLEYIGRCKCHSADIIGFNFSKDCNGGEILMSAAKDNTIVKFDLDKCSIAVGLHLYGNPTCIERESSVIACTWVSDDELIIANEQQKLKVLHSKDLTHKKTVNAPQAPTGKMIRSLQIARSDNAPSFFFCTFENDGDISIVRRPLDGNPSRSFMSSAHPQQIVAAEVDRFGRYFLTMGGFESTIHFWVVNCKEETNFAGDRKGHDFSELLEGGCDGQICQKIHECFDAIAQNCGEIIDERMMIPIEEMISIFRVVGYYPSEEDISNIVSEEPTDAYVDVGSVIQIFVNYKPPEKIKRDEISKAFLTLGNENGAILWSDLAPILCSEGEQMSKTELLTCIKSFVGKFVSPDNLGEANMSSFLRLVQSDASVA